MPRKLIRDRIADTLKPGQFEKITDQGELNYLYELRLREEMEEINKSSHSDIIKFADLVRVAFDYAIANGYQEYEVLRVMNEKSAAKGSFTNIALLNIAKGNPSNKIYFERIMTASDLSHQLAIENKIGSYHLLPANWYITRTENEKQTFIDSGVDEANGAWIYCSCSSPEAAREIVHYFYTKGVEISTRGKGRTVFAFLKTYKTNPALK